MKKIIQICLGVSIFFLVVHSASAVVFTKANTQSMKNFSSVGKYLTYPLFPECGEKVSISQEDAKHFCLNGGLWGFPGYIGQVCNSKISFNILAWCVANDILEEVEWIGGEYQLGVKQTTVCGPSFGYTYPLEVLRRSSECSYTAYKKGTNVNYTGSIKSKRNNVSITLNGVRKLSGGGSKRFKFGMNSPFLYFESQPRGDISVEIDSEYELAKTSTPTFTKGSGWDIKSDGNSISVAGKKQDHLFYELGIQTVELSRNGRNFSSKQELLSYLKTSDFFDKLGFSQIEKVNSLNYIVPKIETSENYYLTLLDEASIKNISTLDIEPTPEQLLRKYFVIYPTKQLVKITGDIVFPENIEEEKQQYTVKDYGEIYVDNSMIVLWK